MRKQAQTTSKPTTGAVLSTMFNPFAGRMGTSRYVPKWFTPSGKDKPTDVDSMLFSALALAATYGSLTAVTRLLASRVQEKELEEKFKKQIRAYVGAQQPIVSPDPSLRDVRREQKLDFTGLKGVIPEPPKLPKTGQMLGPETWSMVVPIVALAGGAYGAYKLVDRIQDKRRIERLDTQIAKERNKIDALNYKYLLESRKPESELVQKMAQEKEEGYWKGLSKWMWGTQKPGEEPHTITGGMLAALMLAATAAFGVGAIATKKYMDARDENRLRLKAVRDAARQMGLSARPPTIMPVLSPKMIRRLNKHLEGVPKALPMPAPIQSVQEIPRQLAQTVTDPTDTLMQKVVNV